MIDLKWSAGEKKSARAAFDGALARECAAIRRDIEATLRDSAEATAIWTVRDYLNERAREVDRKYDYRYSVLIDVFARLLAEGWLALEDLAGLDAEKREFIRKQSEFWKRTDA